MLRALVPSCNLVCSVRCGRCGDLLVHKLQEDAPIAQLGGRFLRQLLVMVDALLVDFADRLCAAAVLVVRGGSTVR